MVLPDLEYHILQYNNDSSPEAVHRFLTGCSLGEKEISRGLSSSAKSFFGRSLHLWMWDYKAMEKELATVGFVDIHPRINKGTYVA